jgi:hypothetical protein
MVCLAGMFQQFLRQKDALVKVFGPSILSLDITRTLQMIQEKMEGSKQVRIDPAHLLQAVAVEQMVSGNSVIQ